MWKAISVVLATCLVAMVAAQGPRSEAVILTSSEIDAVRKGATGDIQMTVADLGGVQRRLGHDETHVHRQG